jgi:hypothetical protein
VIHLVSCFRLVVLSEPKESGKTFMAACLALWWAVTKPYLVDPFQMPSYNYDPCSRRAYLLRRSHGRSQTWTVFVIGRETLPQRRFTAH